MLGISGLSGAHLGEAGGGPVQGPLDGNTAFHRRCRVIASPIPGSQCVLGQFAAECEAAGMRISTSYSESMVLTWKKVARALWVGEGVCLKWRS